jgi:hypothetical protein
MAKTDREIVDEVNEIARTCLDCMGVSAPPDHKFYASKNPRSVKAWGSAVEIYERLTGTEVHDALLAVEENDVEKLFETSTEDLGVIRLERWPEGFVLWAGGIIRWKSWEN